MGCRREILGAPGPCPFQDGLAVGHNAIDVVVFPLWPLYWHWGRGRHGSRHLALVYPPGLGLLPYNVAVRQLGEGLRAAVLCIRVLTCVLRINTFFQYMELFLREELLVAPFLHKAEKFLQLLVFGYLLFGAGRLPIIFGGPALSSHLVHDVHIKLLQRTPIRLLRARLRYLRLRYRFTLC